METISSLARATFSLACAGALTWACTSPGATQTGAGEPQLESVAPRLPAKPLAKGGPTRNLFVEAGIAPEKVEARLTEAYRSLFHGDPANQAILFAAAPTEHGDAAFIMDIGNGDVRSEGMSYGMWIALQMDQKQDFDALWNWARTYMYHADAAHPAYGYFSWQMDEQGAALDEMPAPDGEEYFAIALLMAENRWGNGDGIYDYGREGRRILHDIVHREEIAGPCNACKSKTPRATSLFNREEHQVRFSPDVDFMQSNVDHTDPSYHLPAFYELFALWGPEEDAEFWRTAAKTSRQMFSKFAHPKTGLYPDYALFDGTPRAASWDGGTVNFRFDAWRVAMNIGVDYAWWAADPTEVELVNRLQAFFESEGIKMYGNQYELSGKKLSSDRSSGLIATNGVASLASDHPRAYDFVREAFKVPVPVGKWRYYDGCLHMMSLLYLSGRAQIHWPPGTSTAP